MNDAQNDDSVKGVKQFKYSGYLAQVDVVHVTLIRGLLDIYTCLSKTQHGVRKVNRLPWHYTHRIENLHENLNKISVNKFKGNPEKYSKSSASIIKQTPSRGCFNNRLCLSIQ